MADYNRNGSRCPYRWPRNNFGLIQGHIWFILECSYSESPKTEWGHMPDLQRALERALEKLRGKV